MLSAYRLVIRTICFIFKPAYPEKVKENMSFSNNNSEIQQFYFISG